MTTEPDNDRVAVPAAPDHESPSADVDSSAGTDDAPAVDQPDHSEPSVAAVDDVFEPPFEPDGPAGSRSADAGSPLVDVSPSAEPLLSADVPSLTEPPLSSVPRVDTPPRSDLPPSDLPPFGGFRPPPPPPGTAGYATRFGLVRPLRDRYIAGVCGALARATNTDPVLWRVGLPVLTLLGGLGGLIYIFGWVLIPAEGDTASPLESLAGRGVSSTSRAMAIALTVTAAVLGISTLSDGFGGGRLVAFAVVAGGLVILGGALTAQRTNAWPHTGHPAGPWRGPGGPPHPPWRPAPRWGPPAASPWPAAGPAAAGPGATAWGAPGSSTTGPVTATGGQPAAGGGFVAPAAHVATAGGAAMYNRTPTIGGPTMYGESATTGGTAVDDGDAISDPITPAGSAIGTTDLGTGPAYRPPFAPYGPYAGTSATDPYPLTFPGLGYDPPPVPPKRTNRRTPARRIIVSATLLVVGFIAILDAANVASVSASAYLAAALATVGLGLLICSFFGRTRGPIMLGILLVLALVTTTTVSDFRNRHGEGSILIHPANLAALQSSYSESVGKIVVDLRDVNFTGANTTLDLRINAGSIQVMLPPAVDTRLLAKVNVGSVELLDQRRGGINVGTVTFADDGADGPGGGVLRINANVNVGKVEVTR